MTDGQDLNRYKLENADLKKKLEEAEGELALIKGIGNNSPEMKTLIEQNHRLIKRVYDLKKENNDLAKMIDITREEAQVIQLKADNEIRKFTKRITDLENVNKSHQKLNGELREDLRNVVQKLAESKDLVKTYRKAGIL